MNKDTAIASILGLALGLIAAIALWVVPRILPKDAPQNNGEIVEVTTEDEEDTSTTLNNTSFILAEPIDGTISTKDEITVKGTTPDATYVIISSATSNELVNVDEKGKFESEIELSEGGNEIAVTSFSEDKKTTKIVSVFYTEEDF